MAYHQPNPRPHRVLAMLALTALVGCVFAALAMSTLKVLDRPIVRYDLDTAGKKVCTQVETPRGVTSCESFTKKQLQSFDWEPAFSMPK